MAATVLLEELNGGSETATDKTSGTIRFKNADNATVDTADRLIIPTSDQEYSFRKAIRLNITVVPDVDIQNVRAYSDGANGFGTGVKVWYALGQAAYVEPTVPTESNDPPQFPGATPMIDFFATTSGTPINMDAIDAGPHTATGQFGDYLNLVMEVETNASQGTLSPAETLTFAFDET